MSTPPRSPFEALYAELSALPENRVGEIIDGVLYSFPRPALPHARAHTRLTSRLTQFFDAGDGGGGRGEDGPNKMPGGWVILFESELHIGGNVLVPDIAGWRRERMPSPPETPFSTVSPDWVCEVQSPSTTAHDRKRKLPRYAAMGVQHVWIVDPISKTLEVFKLETASGAGELTSEPPKPATYALSATYSDDEMAAIPPFNAVELDVGALWRW